MFFENHSPSRFVYKQMPQDLPVQYMFEDLGFPAEEVVEDVVGNEAEGVSVVSEQEVEAAFFPFMHELDEELQEDNDAFARSVFDFLKDDVRRSYMYRLIQKFHAGGITASAARNLVCVWAGLSMSCSELKEAEASDSYVSYDQDTPAGELYLDGSAEDYGLRFHYFSFTPSELAGTTKQYFEACGFFDPDRGISYETWLAQLLKFNYQLSRAEGGNDFKAFAEYLMGEISKDSDLSIHMAIPLHLNHEQLRPIEFEYYEIQPDDPSLMSIMRERGVESIYFMQKIQSQDLPKGPPGHMQDIVSDPDIIHPGNFIIVPKKGSLDPIDQPALHHSPTKDSASVWTPAIESHVVPPVTSEVTEDEEFDPENISGEMLKKFGEKIYFNECSNDPENLVAWNKGENFPSLGMGHNTWKSSTDKFAEFLDFCEAKGANLPSWLESRERPWDTRSAFLAETEKRIWLRDFLKKHKVWQVEFMQIRIENALPKILKYVPENQKKAVEDRFFTLRENSDGYFALMDYVNFKGEFAVPQKKYGGIGWGCGSVLMEMRDDEPISASSFAEAAKRVLTRRVAHAPASKQSTEQGWLDAWNDRMDRYKLRLMPAESDSDDAMVESQVPETPDVVTHVVGSGDTIWGLSQKYGVSEEAIKNANGLTSNTIGLGQKLIIPTTSVASSEVYPAHVELPEWDPKFNLAHINGDELFLSLPDDDLENIAQQAAPEEAEVVRSAIHTVVSGDNIWRLSQRYGVSEEAIRTANGLNSNTIHPGKKLVIPGGSDAGFASGPTVPETGKSYDTLQQEAQERGNALPKAETQDQVQALRDRLDNEGVSLWSSGQGYKETGWGSQNAKGRTLLRNMAYHTVDGLLFFFDQEGFDSVDLSGGAEGLNGHSSGIFGHANGRKVDIRFTKDGRGIQDYIEKNGTRIANVSRGSVYYFSVSGTGPDGKSQTYEYEAIIEGNHIDLAILMPQDIAYRIKRYERLNRLASGISPEDFPGA